LKLYFLSGYLVHLNYNKATFNMKGWKDMCIASHTLRGRKLLFFKKSLIWNASPDFAEWGKHLLIKWTTLLLSTGHCCTPFS
jgi:hypothetical protein